MLQNWSVANESGLYSKKGSGVFSFIEALNTINYPYSKTSLLQTKKRGPKPSFLIYANDALDYNVLRYAETFFSMRASMSPSSARTNCSPVTASNNSI